MRILIAKRLRTYLNPKDLNIRAYAHICVHSKILVTFFFYRDNDFSKKLAQLARPLSPLDKKNTAFFMILLSRIIIFSIQPSLGFWGSPHECMSVRACARMTIRWYERMTVFTKYLSNHHDFLFDRCKRTKCHVRSISNE